MRTGGVVLAGGRSSRMGTAKAALEWHGSTLLRRTVGILGRCVETPVVVVAASGQELPAVAGVRVVEDPVEGRGPLQGLAVGLAAAAEAGAEIAFVCATDLPFLHPLLVRRVLAMADGGVEIVLPKIDGRVQPLAGAYRTDLADRAAAVLAAESGEHAGPARFAATCRTRLLDAPALLADPELRAADPDLASLRDVDDPASYREARRVPAPLVEVADGAGGSPTRVRAATLGAALAAVGLAGAQATILGSGHPTRDATVPLVPADRIVVGRPSSPDRPSGT